MKHQDGSQFFKGLVLWVAGLVFAGALYAALDIPTNINNAVQTIQKIVITSDGQAPNGSNQTLVVINSGSGTPTIQVSGSMIAGSMGGTDANVISSSVKYGAIVGGNTNKLSGANSVIIGGVENFISQSAEKSIILGGENNVANGINSIAGGQNAQANHNNTWVWSDDYSTYGDEVTQPLQDDIFASAKSNTFLIRAKNGVGINTANPGAALDVNGAVKQGGSYRSVIQLPMPGANVGAGRWYVRLHPSNRTNLASVKVTVQGSWNYAPIMGWLTAEYSYYSPGDGTINTNDFRVTSTEGMAFSQMRLGNLVVENGYISIPVWSSNTNAPHVIVEYDDFGTIKDTLTSSSWVSNALPAQNFQSIQGNLHVDSNVGIGITTPAARLDVNGTARYRGDSQMDAGYSMYFGKEESFGGSDFGGSDYGFIRWDNDNNSYNYWGDSSENGALVIGSMNDGNNSVSDSVVLKPSGSTIVDSQMIVNGNVGLGINSPISKLHVNGSIMTQAGYAQNAGMTQYDLAGRAIGAANSIYSYGSICVNNNGAECNLANGVVLGIVNTAAQTNIPSNGNVFFNNGGNVGIGTNSPNNKLHVKGLQNNTINSANAVAKFLGNDVGVHVGTLNGSPNYGSWLQSMRDSDNAVFPLSLQPNGGNVGIGTTTPIAKLDVAGGNGTSKIYKEVVTGEPDYSNYYLKLFKVSSGNGWNATTFNGKICALRSNDIGRSQCANVYVSRDYNSVVHFSQNIDAINIYENTPFQLVKLNDGGFDWITLLYDNRSGAGVTSWVLDGTLYNGNAADVVSLTSKTSTSNIHSSLTYTARNSSIPYGNVGIGTAAPGAKLHVESTASAAMKFTRAGANVYGFEIGGSTFGLYDYTNNKYKWNVNGDNLLLNEAGGNVGIGTTSPGSKLHVAGNTQITDGSASADTNPYGTFGVTRVADTSNTLSYIAMTRQGSAVRAMGIAPNNSWRFGSPTANTQYITDADTYMTIKPDGNVGIGTTTPQQKLEVNGHVRFGDNVGGDTIQFEQQGSFHRIAFNDLRFYDWDTGGDMVTMNNGTMTINGKLNANEISTPTLFVDKIVNRTYQNITLSGAFLPDASAPMSVRTIGNTTNRWGELYAGGLNAISDGNVGIGTTSPRAKLEVNGNIRLPATASKIIVGNGAIGSEDDYLLLQDVSAGSPSFQWVQDNSPKFTINGVNGNVGIGTTTPGDKLDVNGNIQLSNGLNSSISMSASPSSMYYPQSNIKGYSLTLSAGKGQNSYHVGATPSDGGDIVLNGGIGGSCYAASCPAAPKIGNVLLAVNGGNVGIGTTTTAAKLDVKDSTSLGSSVNSARWISRLGGTPSNYFMKNDWLLRDASGSDWKTARWHDAISVDVSFLSPGVNTKTWWERDPYDNIQSWGTDATPYMTINNGDVGIGTASPSRKFEVAGDIYANGGWLRTSGSAGWYNESYGGGWYMADTSWIRTYGGKNIYQDSGIMRTDGQLQVGDSGNRFLVNQAGNVGIGTNNIDAGVKLQVAGTIKSTTRVQSPEYCDANGNNCFNSSSFVKPGGSQSTNYLTKWNGSPTIASSIVYDNGTNVGIGTASPSAKLDVRGPFRITQSSPAGYQFTQASDNTSLQLSYYVDATTKYKDLMNFNYDGNVGIGTATPSEKLDVNGNIIVRPIDSNGGIKFAGTNATRLYSDATAGLWLFNSTTSNLFLGTSYDWDTQATLAYTPGTAGAGNGVLSIGQTAKNNANYTHGITSLYTNGQERLKIDKNGNVGIGTTSPSESLDINGGIKLSNNIKLKKSTDGSSPSNSTNVMSNYPSALYLSILDGDEGGIAIDNDGTTVYGASDGGYLFRTIDEDVYEGCVGTVDEKRKCSTRFIVNSAGNVGIGTTTIDAGIKLQVAGNIKAAGFYYSSDITLKKDIKSIDNALDKINQLNGYSFSWKATDKKDLGVIAQEVEKVFPDIVHTDAKGIKSVEYANLVAPIIEAIKSLTHKIDDLFTKYLDQEARIDALEKRLQKLEAHK